MHQGSESHSGATQDYSHAQRMSLLLLTMSFKASSCSRLALSVFPEFSAKQPGPLNLHHSFSYHLHFGDCRATDCALTPPESCPPQFLLLALRPTPTHSLKDQKQWIPCSQTANDLSWSLLSSPAVSGYRAAVPAGSFLAHSSFIYHFISLQDPDKPHVTNCHFH